MPIRKANAQWEGGIKSGNGTMELESGSYKGPYSFASRFEKGDGTNPEELIGAAHAGCFTMAFSGFLEGEGFKPNALSTQAHVSIDPKDGGGFEITKIRLETEGEVPDITEDQFRKIAEQAKSNCPVSMALKSVNIEVDAKLK